MKYAINSSTRANTRICIARALVAFQMKTLVLVLCIARATDTSSYYGKKKAPRRHRRSRAAMINDKLFVFPHSSVRVLYVCVKKKTTTKNPPWIGLLFSTGIFLRKRSRRHCPRTDQVGLNRFFFSTRGFAPILLARFNLRF